MPKLCEACHASSAVVYCRADAAYLCVSCDGKVHGANKLASRHERVWMCEVCELAPAAVTCKADAAALCFSCDSDIHSVNALARRHERVPVIPFFESSCPRLSVAPSKAAVVHINASSGVVAVPPPVTSGCCDLIKGDDTAVVEPASWPFPDLKRPEEAFTKEFFPEVDPYLDLDYATAMSAIQVGTDCLVPVHNHVGGPKEPSTVHAQSQLTSSDSELPHKDGYNHCTSSLSYTISSSSIDMGAVPDSSCSDISPPHEGSQGMLECAAPMVPPGGPGETMVREARVMRYKEKRKNRKFVKTIRYASRKAYAESRPRIKGRFAKRTDSDAESRFPTVPDVSFGVVPTY
ncbi:unnamed protein product [Sphagnum jensenii]|uniref:Zinc finger protein CONSTANS-LIKE 4 n=1 Tax=Sphagnum jensenii TaxID=128206 RepID=A0ABP0WH78_9BRYO